jgi:hypothetical protein
MTTDHEIEEALQRLKCTTTPAQDKRILADALATVVEKSETGTTNESPMHSPNRQAVPHPEFEGRTLPKRTRNTRRLIASAVVATVVLIGVLLWFGRPSDTWADVVEAVRAKPWIYASAKTPDGKKLEWWMSLSREVSASRDGQDISFEDHRLRIKYQYDPKKKVLYRMADSSGSAQSGFLAFGKLFKQLFRGDQSLKIPVMGIEMASVKQKRRTVKDAGRRWVEYELTLRTPEDKQTSRMVFRVDPVTRLPHSLTVTAPGMKPPTMRFLFRYLEDGPVDVYALGVPREAKLVDLVPAVDVARVIDGIKASAERFDSYFAINVMTDAGKPWHQGTPFLVWRKGNRTRYEVGIAEPTTKPLAPPPLNADKRAWWKERCKQLWYIPIEVYDGSTFYWINERPAGADAAFKSNPIVWKQEWYHPKPKWSSRPETRSSYATTSPMVFAYPRNATMVGRPDTDVQLDASPTEGPSNTVLLSFRTRSGNLKTVSREERFWVNPARSYITVRSELNFNEKHGSTQSIVIVEDAVESPAGFWYPTLIRHIEITKNNGKTNSIESLTRHFLDFNVELPDDLFKPVDRVAGK